MPADRQLLVVLDQGVGQPRERCRTVPVGAWTIMSIDAPAAAIKMAVIRRRDDRMFNHLLFEWPNDEHKARGARHQRS
jgi:hypothetical protein